MGCGECWWADPRMGRTGEFCCQKWNCVPFCQLRSTLSSHRSSRIVFLGKQHWLQTLIPAPNLPLVCYIKIQHNSWWLNVVSVSSGNVTSFGTSKNYLTGIRHPPFTSQAKSCNHNWDLKGQYLISRGTRQHFKTKHSWDVGDVKKQVLPGFWSKDQTLRGSSSNSSWLDDLGFCGLKNWKEDF